MWALFFVALALLVNTLVDEPPLQYLGAVFAGLAVVFTVVHFVRAFARRH